MSGLLERIWRWIDSQKPIKNAYDQHLVGMLHSTHFFELAGQPIEVLMALSAIENVLLGSSRSST